MSEWISFEALAVLTVAHLVTLVGLMALVAISRDVQPGFRHWLTSMCLLIFTPVVLLAFPSDAPIRDGRLFASWVPFLASAVFLHEGVRRFRGRPSRWRADTILACATLAAAFAARLLDASYATLLLMLSTAMALILLRAAIACTRGVRPGLRPAYYIFGAGIFWVAGATMVRVLIVLFGALAGIDEPQQTAYVVLLLGGSIGMTVTVVGAIISVGQRQEVEMHDLQEVLRRQATTDSLTGLPNRRYFFEVAHGSIAGTGEHSVALFDIDHFKAVNDSFGHDLGDLVLRRVANALIDSLPASAALGRLGGEEFVALLSGDAASATHRAGQVLVKVEAEAHQGILRRPVTVSAGVAAIGSGGLDAALRRADRRLYQAKQAGRNRVESRTRDLEGGGVVAVRQRSRSSRAPGGVEPS